MVSKPEDNNDQKAILRQAAPYLNLGLQLAITIGGLTLLGWWIDDTNHTTPLWTLVGLGLGLVAGFYNFIRKAIK